ncbi:MAG: restriction endonuclease subunit S, partial [Cellulosilyticaceae bacterium]
MKRDLVKLTDACDFQGGSQPPKDQWITTPKEGYIRMLQIRDFTQNRVVEEFIKLTNTTKTCEEDDILIARYGASVGKILTGLAGAYNVAIMKTIPRPEILDKRYLYYFLKTEYFQNIIQNVGSRAAQAGFNKAELESINIYIQSLDEQQETVNILNKANQLINSRKEQIQACDELIKSQF